MNKLEETIKKHEHKSEQCDHDERDCLVHCPECDTVYCRKCGKEWKQCSTGWTPDYTNIGSTASCWPFSCPSF